MEEQPPVTADSFWEKIRATGSIHGRKAHFLSETESTNTVAHTLAAEGAASGTVIIAESQRAGRGRLNRRWLSPSGRGLYFSVLYRPHIAAEDLPKITLAAAVAACKAIMTTTDLQPQLKWPNDILVDGRKCGGILTELHNPNDKTPIVIIGIGLNVTTMLAELPPELRHKATSLRISSGKHYLRGILLQEILVDLDREIGRLEKGQAEEVLSAWRKLDGLIGRKLAWRTAKNETVTGKALGLAKDGCYLIEDDAGATHEVISGDIEKQSA